MKRNLILLAFFILLLGSCSNPSHNPPQQQGVFTGPKDGHQKEAGAMPQRTLYHQERALYEYNMQRNPRTGTVSRAEKEAELRASFNIPLTPQANKIQTTTLDNFALRGPDNLGGRTRAIVFDLSDGTGNTILAGAVSGGVYRTTDGGTTWTKVSPYDQIHNVTAIAQDPRPGNQNIWYYATGEASGNSASLLGSSYLGQGIWQSTDNGLTWTQMATTSSNQTIFDSQFDLVHRLAVHPTSGELFAGIAGALVRFNGVSWVTELSDAGASSFDMVDVAITSTGRVYAACSGNFDASTRGIWTSPTGSGSWTQIASLGSPTDFDFTTSGIGRIVIAIAPSDEDIVYALYANDGTTVSPGEADLWQWDQGTTTWTNYSSLIPDEPGGSVGNDPFAIQGGYDLVVAVKPDNENFVLIGGTNVYKNTDITTNAFVRMGGYAGPSTYAQWQPSGDEHHSDIHVLTFNPFDANDLLSGTDGGIHRTVDLNAATVAWTHLNNDYQTYQYYHVNIDPQSGSDAVIGGAQDNGTTIGGTSFGLANATNMNRFFSGDGAASAISRAAVCVPLFFSTQNGSMYRFCNPSFLDITPTGAGSDFVTYFYMDPDNNDHIYYAGQNELYKTDNATNVTTTVGAGATDWQNLGNLPTTDYIRSMATSRGSYTVASNLFIGGDVGHIYRLPDPANATDLTALVDITPAGASTTYPSVVSSIAVHPTDPDIVIASYSNYGIPSIFMTTNATAVSPTWTDVERNISDFSVRSVAIVEASGVPLYVAGTARGLFVSENPLTVDWTRVAPNTIGYALVSGLAYRPADSKLLIGTHGNGMFIADAISNVLPVERLQLEAETLESSVQLRWTTTTEQDNKGFEVQRSFDSQTFESIGFVNSAGDSYRPQLYRFEDADLLKPFHYYRLKQIDLDGKSTLSNIVEVQIDLSRNRADGFRAYPNPVQDELTIELATATNARYEIALYNSTGQIVRQQALTANGKLLSLSMQGLAAGTYVLRLSENGKAIGSKQLHKIDR